MNDVLEIKRAESRTAGSCQVGESHPHYVVYQIHIGYQDSHVGQRTEIRLCQRHLEMLREFVPVAIRTGSAR